MNPLNHVAIIMDGNGRWGLKNKNSRNAGHKEGIKVVEKVINYSIGKRIKYLTLFAFSTENWKRPKAEINFLFDLLEVFIKKKLTELNKNNIRIKIIGNKNLTKKLNKLLNIVEKKTAKNSNIQVNLALDYGSRNEIILAIKKMFKKNIKINEKNFENHLFTKNIPNPDILIRTGNTKRLSNFLLWQISLRNFFEKNYSQILTKMILRKLSLNIKK